MADDVRSTDGSATQPGYPQQQPYDVAPSPESESELKHYLYIVLSRWWIILLCVLAGVGAGLYKTMTATPVYRATCKYEVLSDASVTLEEKERQVGQQMNRQLFILQSWRIKGEVLNNLKDKWKDKLETAGMVPRIRVSQSKRIPTMVDLSADSPNRAYALAFLEEMLDVYQKHRRQQLVEAKERSLSKLREEPQQLRQSLE